MTQDTLARLWNYWNFSLDSLSERIRLQKTIYLLQALNYKGLDYSFSMYLYGPYSTELARDAYNLNPKENMPEDIDKLELLKSLINEMTRLSNLPEDKKHINYELLADTVFFSKQSQGKEAIYKHLCSKHAYLSDRANFEIAWKLLSEHRVVN